MAIAKTIDITILNPKTSLYENAKLLMLDFDKDYISYAINAKSLTMGGFIPKTELVNFVNKITK